MKSEKKNELEIRKASSYDIKYPESQYLDVKKQKKIQKAVNDGGISIGVNTYISESELPKLLSTDRKGVTNIMMEIKSPEEDLRMIGNTEYMSTPQLQKEISKRRQQMRSITEQEELRYSQECIDAFLSNEELSKKRAIEADKIKKNRSRIGTDTIKARRSTVSELSGRPLNGNAEVHHKDRIADKPERAFDSSNLTVMTKDEHAQYHKSKYPQNEKGYEQFKKDYLKKTDNK